MVRYFFLGFLLLIVLAAPSYAQIYETQYRAPKQEWMEIHTERFRLIYPRRYQTEAFQSLAILESEYPDIQQLVGGSIQNFPVILNPENDNSNGFVSAWNFRSEVELSPTIGKSMNPKSGGWLEHVLPHELTHVMHYSKNPPSVTQYVGLLSPDMRRAVHGAAPFGFFEGLAVQYESHNGIPEAGRGHYPYFRNQFRSVLGTDDEWSMGQLIQTSSYTPPFGRHYIGGYEFVNWLLKTYGEDSMKGAIEFHYRYPFLGFGTALRHETGKWPGALKDQFDKDKKTAEVIRLKKIGNSTDQLSEEVPFSANCVLLHRPKWLDDQTLIFFGRSCNRTTGFYTYHTESRSFDLLKEVSITDDYVYSFSDDKKHLAYSRYHSHILFDNLYQGDLHKLDIEMGKSERITKKERLFSPDWFDGNLLALQTKTDEMNLVLVDANSGDIVREYSKPDESTIVQVAVNPYRPGTMAVIGRIKSVQGIWFENLDDDSLLESDPAIVFKGGSVFDLAWHPSEEKLLFVSDYTGVMNVFEHDVHSEQVVQLTNSEFNVFEASYSPDGNQIAYIQQEKNEQTLHLLNIDDAIKKEVPKTLWQFDEQIAERFSRSLMNRDVPIDTTGWEPQEYSTGFSWLKPRYWAPTYEQTNGYHRPGLTFESVDVMNSQTYELGASYMAEKLWYNLSYDYKGAYPGFRVELYDEPFFNSFQTDNEENETYQELLQESRGASLKIPIPLRLKSNVRFSSLYFEPQYFVSQIRFLDPENSSTPVSDFGTRHTLGFRTVFNWNLRQFIRDVQPNSGWSFFIEGRQALNNDQFKIETDQLAIDGTLSKRRGLRSGAMRFLSPFKRWNQSLRLSAQIYSQTDIPVFGVTSHYSDLFSDNPFPGANNIGILNTRYTIPLIYLDNGGLLLPFYLSNIYVVLFSQTVTDADHTISVENSRTVFGGGIRSKFRLSNLSFDVGISIGWEPTRDNITYHIGSF